MDYLTCYKTLGVRPGATMPEIHQAYKRLALRYHPDRSGSNAAFHAEFCRITEAYATLRKACDLQSETSGPSGICPRCGNVDALFQGLQGQLTCAACLLAQRRKLLPLPDMKVVRCLLAIVLQIVALYCLGISWFQGSMQEALIGLGALVLAWGALSWNVLTSSLVSER